MYKYFFQALKYEKFKSFIMFKTIIFSILAIMSLIFVDCMSFLTFIFMLSLLVVYDTCLYGFEYPEQFSDWDFVQNPIIKEKFYKIIKNNLFWAVGIIAIIMICAYIQGTFELITIGMLIISIIMVFAFIIYLYYVLYLASNGRRKFFRRD